MEVEISLFVSRIGFLFYRLFCVARTVYESYLFVADSVVRERCGLVIVERCRWPIVAMQNMES